MFFSWELNIPKLLVVEEVGGDNFHGFNFLWAREDEIVLNFKLGKHKDDWMQEFKQTYRKVASTNASRLVTRLVY